MKVDDVRRDSKSRGASRATGGKGASAASKAEAPEQVGFAEQIGMFLKGDRRGELDKLLAAIDRSQETLMGEFTFENLYSYKSSVAKFLRTALDTAYEPQITEGKTKSGKTKQLMTARLVNEKVQALIDEVLKRHGALVNYMDRLNEIRGLLVDMYE